MRSYPRILLFLLILPVFFASCGQTLYFYNPDTIVSGNNLDRSEKNISGQTGLSFWNGAFPSGSLSLAYGIVPRFAIRYRGSFNHLYTRYIFKNNISGDFEFFTTYYFHGSLTTGLGHMKSSTSIFGQSASDKFTTQSFSWSEGVNIGYFPRREKLGFFLNFYLELNMGRYWNDLAGTRGDFLVSRLVPGGGVQWGGKWGTVILGFNLPLIPIRRWTVNRDNINTASMPFASIEYVVKFE